MKMRVICAVARMEGPDGHVEQDVRSFVIEVPDHITFWWGLRTNSMEAPYVLGVEVIKEGGTV